MSRRGEFALISFLFIAFGLAVSPVLATVETVNVSPSMLVVGEPITFSGVDVETISPNKPPNNVLMHIYPGFGCSLLPANAIAVAITSIELTGPYTGAYNTTLSFPATVTPSGQGYSGSWVVTGQSYQNGLPVGSYSISVTDTEAVTNGASGACRNFTVSNSSAVAEFSGPVVVMSNSSLLNATPSSPSAIAKECKVPSRRGALVFLPEWVTLK